MRPETGAKKSAARQLNFERPTRCREKASVIADFQKDVFILPIAAGEPPAGEASAKSVAPSLVHSSWHELKISRVKVLPERLYIWIGSRRSELPRLVPS
jgi:hypothetical protein